MASIGSATIDVRSRDTSFQRATKQQRAELRRLRREAGAARRTLRNLGRGLANAGRTALRFAAGAAASVVALSALVRNSISYSDNLAKTARAAGLTVEELQGLRHELELQGVAVDKIDTFASRFTVSFSNINKQSSLLKTTLRDLDPEFLKTLTNVTDQRKAFDLLIERLRSYQTTGRAASVLEPFVGARQAARLAEAIRATDNSLSDMITNAQRVGPILTTQLADRAQELNDRITVLGTNIRGTFSVAIARNSVAISNAIDLAANSVGPAITTIVNVLPRAFEGIIRAATILKDNLGLIVSFAKAFIAVKIGVAAATAASGVIRLATALKSAAAAGTLFTLSNPATAIIGIIAAIGGYAAVQHLTSDLTSDIEGLAAASQLQEETLAALLTRQTRARAELRRLTEESRSVTTEGEAIRITNRITALNEELQVINKVVEAKREEARVRTNVAETVTGNVEAVVHELSIVDQTRNQIRKILDTERSRLRIAQSVVDFNQRNLELARAAAEERERELEAATRLSRSIAARNSVIIQTGGLENANRVIDEMRNRMQLLTRAADTVANAFGNAVGNIITGFRSVSDSAKDLARTILSELTRVAVLQPLVDLVGGGLRDFIGFGGLGRRQSGGPVRRGQPYIVGEGGAELFIPERNGAIISNRDLRRGAGSGGNTININITGNPDPDGLIARLRNEVVPLIDEQLNVRQFRSI